MTIKGIRGYILRAAAKSVAGISLSDIHMTHAALAVFLCAKHCHIRIMVGCVGASSEAPDFMWTGKANPAQLTTN